MIAILTAGGLMWLGLAAGVVLWAALRRATPACVYSDATGVAVPGLCLWFRRADAAAEEPP